MEGVYVQKGDLTVDAIKTEFGDFTTIKFQDDFFDTIRATSMRTKGSSDERMKHRLSHRILLRITTPARRLLK